MKTKILFAAALIVYGLAVSCNKNDKTETPTGAFSGYITNGDVTKEILRSAFVYSEADEDEEDDGICKIYLSPRNIDGTVIYQTHEWLMISIPLKLLGTVIDLDDPLQYHPDVQLEYHRGMSYGSAYGIYGIAPVKHGTLKVTMADGNYFAVELPEMELLDGSILSCQAAGVIDTEYEYEYAGDEWSYIKGETDFTLNGTAFTLAGYTCYSYGWIEERQYYLNSIIFTGYRKDNIREYCQFTFEIANTTTPFVSSGSYSIDDTEKNISASFMHFKPKGDGYGGRAYDITAGSFDLEISDDYCKLTLNDDIETADPDVPVFPAATFTFDYRDI